VGKVDKSKAAKTGDFLYRYLWARHRCVGAPAPSDPSWLAYLIEWGKKKFDNVYVEPDESPPIVWDNQHPAFFSAMVKMDYGDMPRLADLAAWRTYVLYNSLPPKRPGGPEPAELDRASSAPLQHDPIAEVWGKPPMIGDETPPTRKWQLDPVRPRIALAALQIDLASLATGASHKGTPVDTRQAGPAAPTARAVPGTYRGLFPGEVSK
jgi:hypothetical protein